MIEPIQWPRRRHVLRFLVMAPAILAVALNLTALVPTATANPDILSTDTTACEGPASTPACASKTWDDCFWHQDPALCAAIGRPEIKFWSIKYSDNSRQITLTAKPVRTEPMANDDSARVVGVRAVQGRRFDWTLSTSSRDSVDFRKYRPCLTPRSRRGTHEVMLGWPDNQDEDKFHDAHSRFFRREGDRWVLTAWTWWHHEHLCIWDLRFAEPECDTLIYVVSWDKWHTSQ